MDVPHFKGFHMIILSHLPGKAEALFLRSVSIEKEGSFITYL